MTRNPDGPARRRRPRHVILGILGTAAVIAVVSGCGPFGSADGSGGASSGGAGPEQHKITIGVMPVVDNAPVYIAIQKGYFKQEGLTVELKTIKGGAAGIPGLVHGELNFTFGNWVSFFLAQAKGAADLKLISDAYQAQPGMFLIMVRSDSPIKEPKDLAGKTVAINTRANILELTATAVLQVHGMDTKTISFVELPFPDMQAALQRKDVDAAFMVEPFITQAERTIGAIKVVDAASGPTQEIPIAGYATSAQFARENPRTVEAFRRAMAKAQQDAHQREQVEQVITAYTKVDEDTASLLHLGTYPTTLEPRRLQRVVDLMKTYGVLTDPVDVNSMITEPARK